VKRWFVLYEQQRLMNILQMLLQSGATSQKITHPLSLPFMIANDPYLQNLNKYGVKSRKSLYWIKKGLGEMIF
jgi:hypothetical protein